jgi:cytidylate kinase
MGAGGEAVGRAVADRLGFRYVDDEIISRASEKAQVDPKLIAEAERRQSLLSRLLDAIGVTGPMPQPIVYLPEAPVELAYYAAGVPVVPVVHEDYRTLIREVIQEVATQGKAVIVAHAASLALANRQGVLRVFVTASPETRAQRLRESGQAADEQAARHAVRDSDRDRHDYLKRFYKIAEELPTHYDLVINTDVLPPMQAVNLIVAAAQS